MSVIFDLTANLLFDSAILFIEISVPELLKNLIGKMQKDNEITGLNSVRSQYERTTHATIIVLYLL